MNVSSAVQALPQEFIQHFRLDNGSDITSFFAVHRGDPVEALRAQVLRIVHFVRTHVWISEENMCDWALRHPEQKMSGFFPERRLQRKLFRYEQGMVVPRQAFWRKCKESFDFLVEFLLHSGTVGALLPSSKYLAKEMASELPIDSCAPKRLVLEIGPGTGVFTDRIIKRLNPTDELHLVEFDENFCAQLQEKYRHLSNVKVFHQSILDYSTAERKYDYVFSGLPLNAFPASTVQKIFTKFQELTAEGGSLSYFEYQFIPVIMRLWQDSSHRVEIDSIGAQKKAFYEQHHFRKATVFRNVPPAMVLHHRFVTVGSAVR